MTALLLLVVSLIVYGSLYPWHFDFGRTHGNPLVFLLHTWPPPRMGMYLVRDVVDNVLLYLPVGMLAFLAAARSRSKAAAFCFAAFLSGLLSLSMELLQIYDIRRDSSLSDVLANLAGGCLGALFAPAVRARIGRTRRHMGRHQATAMLVCGCWFTYQLYPFFPVASRTRLRGAILSLLHPGPVSVAEVWVLAAGWFVAALALEGVFGRLPWPWLATTMVCLPVRVFIAGRTPGWTDLFAAALGVCLWIVIPRAWRHSSGLWIALSAIVTRELEPFHLVAPAARFSWIPFAPSLDADREAAALILFGKVFYYGGAIWLGKIYGWTYVKAGLLVAGMLLILEWTQRHLPGRSPEISEVVIALLVAAVLRILDGK